MTNYFLYLFLCSFIVLSSAYGQSSWYAQGNVNLKINGSAQLHIIGDAKFDDNTEIESTGMLSITGDFVNLSSVDLFGIDTGMVVMKGASAQNLLGDFIFYQLEIDNPTTVSNSSGEVNITHTLFLNAGTFNSNDSVYIKSTATRTARVAESGGGSSSGDFIVERYVATGVNGWRMLAAPISGATLQEWQGDFYTSGYTGSQNPGYSFTSVVFYDETQLGAFDVGYVEATNTTNSISAGIGAFVYLGPLPLTFDATGPLINGSHNFSVTNTAGGVSTDDDGWHILGNPYASAIDWDAATGWTRTDVNDAFYVWDAQAGQYRSYVNGVGTNGGTSVIPSSQAFFVKSVAGSPLLTCTEAVKTADEQAFIYKPTRQQYIKFRVNVGTYQDEAVVRFNDQASPSFDSEYDAAKAPSLQTYSPSIYSTTDSVAYSINTIPLESGTQIPLFIEVNWPADYTFQVQEIVNLPPHYCFRLYDSESGSHLALNDSFNLSLFLDTGVIYDRFRLEMVEAYEVASASAACFGDSSAKLSIEVDSALSIWTSVYSDSNLLFQDSVQGKIELQNVAAGNYDLNFEHSSCAISPLEIEIQQPLEIYTEYKLQEDSVVGKTNLSLSVYGGTPPYLIFWQNPFQTFGDTLAWLSAGVYLYQVTDANNCFYYDSVTIDNVPVLNVESQSNSRLNVWPNPTAKQLNINNVDGPSFIQVYDVIGRRVLSQQGYSSFVELDLSNLLPGTYFIQIEEQNLSSTFKIIKTQ
jgi:hypothetical protein